MSESVGEQLRLERQARKISLDQVSQSTHIRVHYLEALEVNDLSRLPSKAHARGFLRAYAGYLGLDGDALLRQMDGEGGASATLTVPEPAVEQEAQQPHGDYAAAFEEIGQALKSQRELLGFSLEEVERNTHVRQYFLRALEDGRLEDLPSPVQGRGMLQNYADFLGLDSDPLMMRFADGLQARLAERQVTRPRPAATKVFRRRRFALFQRTFPIEMILIGGLVVALVGFVVWGALRITSYRAVGSPTATIPSIAEALLITPEVLVSEVPTASPSPETGQAIENTPAIVVVNPTNPAETAGTTVTPEATTINGPVQVNVSVLQRAWMRVAVDGKVEFEGRVIPGSAYSFAGNVQVELLTGNGAALQVFFNRTDLGVLGDYGEVVYRVFTTQGMVVPTPTVTRTATITPVSTVTPPPTGQPSLTPLP